MRVMTFRWKTLIAVTAIAGVLSACDQTEERLDRARGLTDAVRDQIAGEVGTEDGQSALKSAKLADRAIAGLRVDESELPQPAQRSVFATGSIIAKPRLQSAFAVESADAEPADTDGDAPASRTLSNTFENARLRRSPSEIREQLKQRVEEGAKEITERIPAAGERPAVPRRGLTRTLPQDLERKVRTDMMDAMARYGLSGDVLNGTDGEMVIQLGVDPTQFSTESVDALADRGLMPRFAAPEADGCPDTVTPQAVQSNPALATECVVRALTESGDYEYVDKDFIFAHQLERLPENDPVTTTPTLSATPNDPLFDLQWHFKSIGDGADKSLGGSGFADYWSNTDNQGSRDIVVAVVDTGLQLDHPDIINSPNIVAGYDMVSDPRMGNDGDGRDTDPNDPGDRCDPSNPLQRDSFHGTHVAGTIGAATTNNASGVAGGAWNVTVVPIRALGRCGGRLSDINDGIRWAAGLIPGLDDNGNEVWNENPADIINLSIGLFEPCPASMQDAIDAAVSAGSIVVTAAGNARVSTRYYAPGGCRNVVSVAAGDALGQIAPYSNYGAEVDILAPGGDVTADANNDGRPDGVLSTKLAQNCYDPVTGSSVGECFYAYEQGTSMAAPHVSAALALIKAQLEADNGADFVTAEDVTDMLMATVLPRSQMQCSGKCTSYPGTAEIEGQPGQCYRPCGEGMLNLAAAAE